MHNLCAARGVKQQCRNEKSAETRTCLRKDKQKSEINFIGKEEQEQTERRISKNGAKRAAQTSETCQCCVRLHVMFTRYNIAFSRDVLVLSCSRMRHLNSDEI